MSDMKDPNLPDNNDNDNDETMARGEGDEVDTQSFQQVAGSDDNDASPEQQDGETIPVRPEEPAVNGKKPRPGEITEDMIRQRTSTRKLGDTDFEDGDPRWGTARFSKRMLLEIKLRDDGERFTFDYEDIEEIVIGRRDPNTGQSPAVDLEQHGALNKGVSRKHASIVRRDGALNLVDRGSPNGTFLNGQKLVAEQPRILRDGDDVRLGHLVVRVSFRPADMGG
ncbi:MAG: FHA domain-containing protein [Chloroflexota bacterium]